MAGSRCGFSFWHDKQNTWWTPLECDASLGALIEQVYICKRVNIVSMRDTCDADSDIDTCDHFLIEMGKIGLVT